ncbi:oligosaccharide flippase family protein [Synechococcales cyanobacterium C]|uniref:Oligosaccharide flippase family protein n=1 Tax=Petrachloros mirabilis ULC683 TaxID=2781853 RepID=A0A8K2A0H3_9CYAN|nr:oligosaccharide flippase family protein [Petrachloros mirabilis]NCJ07497.1 oligosaccharide flippase family protein [Petrachloros mirabilis ULC683]
MPLKKIKHFLSGKFIQNVGWLGAAEIANRLFRVGTTVTLARIFSTEDYGLMAQIYIIFDLSQVFTLKGGIAAKVIHTEESSLETICRTSYWLNWILCIGVFLLQLCVAWSLAYAQRSFELGLQLSIVGLIYLMFPLYTIQAALIERQNRLEVHAYCVAAYSFLSNFITIVLAVWGFGVWSIVWAMVISMPVWIVISRWQHPWRAPTQFRLDRWREVIRFGGNLLGVEILGTMRLNADYLIVRSFLGVEALGLYYFAYNAGSGITSSILSKLMIPLFPYLCEVRTNSEAFKKRYWSSFKTVLLTMTPIVLLQASLAPWYVPIIFGAQWVPAIPILILICLAILPITWGWLATILLNAMDKTHIPLYFGVGYTGVFVIAILGAVRFQALGVAIAVLCSHFIGQSLFALGAHWYVFRKLKSQWS